LHAYTTWHYGLLADWWANFNLGAPEVDLYRPYLRDPILDAGCGAGRLLAPLRELGHDVDGCDASPDMIDRCRRRAPDATLWVSRLHELEPPRRYATIIVCGVFGIATSREEDEQAVARLHDALLPGGTLVLDNEEVKRNWQIRDWSENAERKTTTDGVEFALRSRVTEVGEDGRLVRMQIRAETSDGRREEHELTVRQWYRDELVPLLERNGFDRVEVKQGVDEEIVVYVASRTGQGEGEPGDASMSR
jgi:SAM-dependent methyltransferase